MINRQSIHFMAYFMRAYPLRSLLGVGCLLLAGLLEGIGLAALLPLLELTMNADSSAAMSPLGATVLSILRQLHLNPSLATLLGLIVIGMTLKNLSTWYAMQQVGYTVAQVANDLRLNLIDSLLRARWNFFTRHPSGYFANGIAMEALRASMAYQEGISVISALFQIAVYTTIAALISWRVAIVSMLAGLALMVALERWVRRSREAGKMQTDLWRSLAGRLTDALQGIKPVKAMSQEHLLLPLLKAETEGLMEGQRDAVTARSR